jgi:hypothetical protein
MVVMSTFCKQRDAAFAFLLLLNELNELTSGLALRSVAAVATP